MNTRLIERAIIANRPLEPFVLVEFSPPEIDDLSTLAWQADTEPPTWEEASAWAAALAVEEGREAATATVMRLLAESDHWAARAVEEGVPMTPERVAYRKALRATLTTIASSDDSASVPVPEQPATRPEG